jgi:hypothetical protein
MEPFKGVSSLAEKMKKRVNEIPIVFAMKDVPWRGND